MVSLFQGPAMSNKNSHHSFSFTLQVFNQFHHEIQFRHENRTGLHVTTLRHTKSYFTVTTSVQ